MGSATAAQVEQAFTIDRQPEEVRRLRRIGYRLVAGLPASAYPYEFHVIHEREINAFALPGGFIYVFRGLLQALPRDDALAFVLAHEITHVDRRHAVRQFEKDLVLGAALQGILAGVGAGWGTRSAAQVAQTVAAVSFTREDESEADRLGFDLLVRAGYDPSAAAEAMEVVARLAGDGRDIPRFLRSHPAPGERAQSLRRAAQARRPPAGPSHTPSPVAAAIAEEDPLPAPGPAEPCRFLPLTAGREFRYSVRGAGLASEYVVRVESVPAGREPGLLTLDVGPGLPVRQEIWTTRDGAWVRPAGAHGRREWKQFLRVSGAGNDVEAAGDEVETGLRGFPVVRIRSRSSAGEVIDAWFQEGLGLYRRAGPRGILEELVERPPADPP